MEANRHILSGWKEVACYLHLGVRTAQRWEEDLGLPIHRPQGRKRSAVVANAQEIDLWLHSRPIRLPVQNANVPLSGEKAAQKELLLRSRELRAAVSHSREAMAKARENLMNTLSNLLKVPHRTPTKE